MIIPRNNPGNIRKSAKFTWQGEVPGILPGHYLSFETLTDGYRAQIKDLNTKITQGNDTIAKIITKYAPEADNNPTEKYIQYVSAKTGIDRDAKLKANDWNVTGKIAYVMSWFEHGIKDDDGTLTTALKEAKGLLSGVLQRAKDNPGAVVLLIAAALFFF